MSQITQSINALSFSTILMTDDECQELVASIKENGQRVHIMLDPEGKVLVDGRNRLEACKVAGVEPIFDRLPVGTDLNEYVMI